MPREHDHLTTEFMVNDFRAKAESANLDPAFIAAQIENIIKYGVLIYQGLMALYHLIPHKQTPPPPVAK